MSSPSAPITGATAAIALFPQIELPQAMRIAIRVLRPCKRQMPKLAAMATTTTPAMPKIIAGPIASTACTLTDAPSSMTAISSRSLADTSMPRLNKAGGAQAVRTTTPSRIARTNASM